MHERLTTALDILRSITDRTRPLEGLSVGVLASMAGTSTSSTSRICSDLESVGFIAHADGYGTYRIGTRAVELSGAAAAPFAIAADFALTLAYQTTGETVALVARAPRGAVVIGVVQSAWTLHVGTSVGDLLTDPGSAAVRALQHPASTGTQRVALSSRAGVGAEVATSILDPQGDCVAALVVRYPSHRAGQVRAMAERTVLTTRRHLERSIAPASTGRPTTRPAPTRTEGRSAIEAAAAVLGSMHDTGTTSVAELSARTGLRPDRVRRLLEVCDHAGLVDYPDDRDTAAWQWGVHGWHRGIVEATLRGPAQQLVAAASAKAGHTAYLTVRRGMRSSTVAESIVDGALTMGSWLGRPAQLIGSDGGPVLIQHFDDAQIRQVFPSRITMTASGTPKDLAEFLRQVQRARSDQPLVLPDFGEDGLTSVAAPVRDAGGAVVAAACIVGPGPDVATRLPAIKRLTCKLADDVSGLLRAPVGMSMPS